MNTLTPKKEEIELIHSMISNTIFIHNAYIDLTAFFALLNYSLQFDGFIIHENIIFHEMMESCLKEDLTSNETALDSFTHIKINNVEPNTQELYKDGYMYAMKVSSFILIFHKFIYLLGKSAISNNTQTDNGYMAYWIDTPHKLTLHLFKSLFTELRLFTKNIDKNNNIKASIQNLNKQSSPVTSNKIDLYANFIAKDQLLKKGIQRVEKAISDKYYLEAIAILESIICDQISLFLWNKNESTNSKISFSELTKLIKDYIDENLFNEINDWRLARNCAIHSMVRSSPNENQISFIDLDLKNEKIASTGLQIAKEIIKWLDDYIYEEKSPFKIMTNTEYEFIKNTNNKLKNQH